LVYATLGSLTTNVPPEILGAMAWAGQDDRARNYATLIQDATRRSKAYQLISDALLAQKKEEQAVQVLTQALAAAVMIDAADREAFALSQIARRLDKVGRRAQALEMLRQALSKVETIQDTSEQRHALSEIAQTMAEIDDPAGLEAALVIAESIRYPWHKTDALCNVALAMGRVGDKAGVHRAMEAVDDSSIVTQDARIYALSTLTLALALAGDDAGLQHTLSKIDSVKNIYWVPGALKRLGKALVRVGQIERALALAGQPDSYVTRDGLIISSPEPYLMRDKLIIFGEIVTELIRTGQTKRASDIARKALAETPANAQAIGPLAHVLVQVGDRTALDHLLEKAVDIPDEEDRAEALGFMAPVLVDAGDESLLERVLVSLETIARKSQDIRILTLAAETLAQTGQKKSAIEAINLAIEATFGTIEKSPSMTLVQAAKALVQFGKVDKAVQLASRAADGAAQTIGQAEAQLFTFSRAIDILVTLGQTEEARTRVEQARSAVETRDEPPIDFALSELAVASIYVGQVDQALSLLGLSKTDVTDITNDLVCILNFERQRPPEDTEDDASQASEPDWLAPILARLQGIGGVWESTDLSASNVVEILSSISQALTYVGKRDVAVIVKDLAMALAKMTIAPTLPEPLTKRDYSRPSYGRKASALGQLALALAQVKDLDSLAWTVEIAQQIHDLPEQVQVKGQIAQALANVEDSSNAKTEVAQAVQLAENFERTWLLARAFQAQVRVLVQLGDLEDAQAVAEGLADQAARAWALGEVARGLTHVGEQNRALSLLRPALAAARQAGRDSVLEVLGSSAITLATLDQGQTLWEAIKVATDIETWWHR
jgi:tetratricopeptide (TPR) repeat protein